MRVLFHFFFLILLISSQINIFVQVNLFAVVGKYVQLFDVVMWNVVRNIGMCEQVLTCQKIASEEGAGDSN